MSRSGPLRPEVGHARPAWALLAVGRVGRPERGWLDRLGRGLGWYWVALLVLAVSRVQPD